ncbi:MAG: hypothetical protein NC218_09590 [Acetobacter sp.]|nr:hypothetical protein [Acetobacter sp.]
MHNPIFDKDGKMISWMDSVGGQHAEGLGWDPCGNFCGECSSDDCSTCHRYDQILMRLNMAKNRI